MTDELKEGESVNISQTRKSYYHEVKKLDKRAEIYNNILDKFSTKISVAFIVSMAIVMLSLHSGVFSINSTTDYFYILLSVLVLGYMLYYLISFIVIQFEYVYLDDSELVRIEETLWATESKVDQALKYPIYPSRKYIRVEDGEEQLFELNHDYNVINCGGVITLYNCVYEEVQMVEKEDEISLNYNNLGKVFLKVYEGAPNKLTIHNIKFKETSLAQDLGIKEVVVIEVEPTKYLDIKE